MAINDFFVWGKGGAKLTPDQIERERQIADALIKQGVDFSPVGHWTQGAARMANALVGNLRQGRADRAQSEGIASATDAFNNSGIAELLAGGNSAVNQPQASSQAATTSSSYQPAGNDVRDGIIATANSLGIDPLDLATAISYETGGTFDPTKSGPTTKWGTHRGLIQFGEPQAKQYGIDWSNPVASQLGENGAVANYLRDTGVKPGMGLLDVYSAINAGGVGRYNRSDTSAGGAPGTVRDKVEQQMAGHRRKAQALLGEGVQVASADPNFMPQASSEATMSPVAQALVQPASAASAPIQQQAMTAPAPQPNPVSEALIAQNDIALGGSLAPSSAGQPRQSSPNLQGLIQLANNPFLNDAQRGMVNTALQYQMQQNDPVRALKMQQIQQGLRKGDLEIAALQAKPTTKYGFTTLPDGTVVRTNEATGEVLPAYEGAPKPTTTMQELAAAGLQPGTAEYRQAIIDSQRRGTSVTTNVGEQKEDAKFWEGMGTAQAKQFTDMIDTGNVARRNKVNLDRLSQLAANSPQGLQGAAVNTLANLGIKLDGASNVEAMESLISQLVPSQRPPGSGTISDADLALYKSSLPRIVNSTKGNQLILETLYAINEHDQAAADIADRVANRELTPAQARAELRKIPNPFDNWQEKVKAASQPQPVTQQSQGGNKTKSGVTWSVN